MNNKTLHHFLSLFFCLFSCFFCGVNVYAVSSGICGRSYPSWRDHGLMTWSLDDEGFLTIGGSGNMYNYDLTEHPPWGQDIKGVIFEEGIDSIGNYAFYNCKNLETVIIPYGVYSIGEGAFYQCKNLKRIELPDSAININANAFGDCRALESIRLPAGWTKPKYGTYEVITAINSGVFSGCLSLKEITIPKGVTKIQTSAFSGCSSLESITLPDTVTAIGDGAFNGCTSLQTVYYGYNEYPSYSVGNNNTPLINATIIRGVNGGSCGNNLHWDFNDGTLTISGTGQMSDYNSSKRNQPWASFQIYNVIIEEGVTSIGDAAFYSRNPVLAEAVISDTVTSIGKDAFYSQYNLASISPLTNVVTIKDSAFSNCHAMSSPIIIPKIRELPSSAFNGCWYVKEVQLGENLEKIDSYAFFGLRELTSIRIPANVNEIADNAFSGCDALELIECTCGSYGQVWAENNNYQMDISHIPTTIAAEEPTCTEPGHGEGICCESCNMIMEEPETVEALGHDWAAPGYDWAEDYSSATAVRVCKRDNSHQESETVTTTFSLWKAPTDDEEGETLYRACFEKDFFEDQEVVAEDIPAIRNMSTLNLPTSIKDIKREAFAGLDCECIIIPDGCESIGEKAFSDNNNLIYIRIPESVKTLSQDAFNGCGKIRIDDRRVP